MVVIFSHADVCGEEVKQHAEEGDLGSHGPARCPPGPRLPGQGEQIQYVKIPRVCVCVFFIPGSDLSFAGDFPVKMGNSLSLVRAHSSSGSCCGD